MKIKEDLSTSKGVISFFINACIASLKVKKLEVNEPNKKIELRPYFHFLFMAQFGSCKSTVLNEIAVQHNLMPYTSLTRAGLVGTVDQRTLQVIPAGAWENRNKLLLIDEFKMQRKDDVLDPLLQLMEGGTYKKKFGMFSAETNEEDPPKDPNCLFFKVKQGEIKIKTRFAAIIATMRWLEYEKNPEVHALISRAIPFRWFVTSQELKNIALGNPVYITTNYKPKHNNAVIRKKDYLKIKDFVDNVGIDNRIYLRTIGDCCRMFNVLGKHNEGVYGLIARLKQDCIERHEQAKQERTKGKKGEK